MARFTQGPVRTVLLLDAQASHVAKRVSHHAVAVVISSIQDIICAEFD